MAEAPYSQQFMTRLIDRILAGASVVERLQDGGPFRRYPSPTGTGIAGTVRLWAATDDSLLDRLVHCRLQSDPVDTHLLFLFGRADTAMPHFHGQVVQFGPDGFVYNADIVPRLDGVEHPDWFTEVYGPVTKAYWKVATDRQNVASMAPANPSIALYLSPWSIAAGRPTNRAELDRAEPSIHAYIDHCLALARGLRYAGAAPEALRERDERHLALLQSDALDPRAWKGVYRLIGEAAGRELKDIFRTPLRKS
jgi:hypothetical protein